MWPVPPLHFLEAQGIFLGQTKQKSKHSPLSLLIKTLNNPLLVSCLKSNKLY